MINPDVADQLRGLRRKAGLTGAQLEQATGISRHTISKVENKHRAPQVNDIRTWVKACGGTDAQAERLVNLAEDARASWQDRISDGGQVVVQAEYADLVAASTRIVFVEQTLVPGPLQTPDYARRILTWSEERWKGEADPVSVDAAVAARTQTARHLADPTKKWEFIICEGAFHVWYVPQAQRRAQMVQVMSLIGSPTVTMRVVPQHVELGRMIPAPLQVFDNLAIVEHSLGEARLTVDEDKLQTVLGEARSIAVDGDDARALIAGLIA